MNYNCPTNKTCNKSGIKIHHSNNNVKNPITLLDLDLNNYSLNDLYKLFNITDNTLSEPSLKHAKQIVLKMHPDLSMLDSKYFLFFSKAYKRLYGIYEFQNKSHNKSYKDEDFFDESNKNTLNNLFDKNKEFKDPVHFNKWFNDSFEKHRLENPNEIGYGEWLKSDDGIMNISENVTKSNMNEIFEQKKKQMQSVSVYTGVTDLYSSNLGASSLLSSNDNFTTELYTDLRQAYTETLIPVTHEDYENIPKYNNVSEYKKHRDMSNSSPLSKEESENILLRRTTTLEDESTALAFKYAQESDRAKQKQQCFWGDIRQITNC
jgi:hypothetical protein